MARLSSSLSFFVPMHSHNLMHLQVRYLQTEVLFYTVSEKCHLLSRALFSSVSNPLEQTKIRALHCSLTTSVVVLLSFLTQKACDGLLFDLQKFLIEY